MSSPSTADTKKLIVFITSSAPSLVRFRLPLIKKHLTNGFAVICSAPSFDSHTFSVLDSLGIVCHSIPYDRRSRNPIDFIGVFWRYYFYFLRVKPSATFSYFLIPILLSSLSSFIARVPNRFIFFEGLGSIFTRNPFFSFQEKLVVFLLRPPLWILLHVSCILCTKSFFINGYDRSTIAPFNISSRRSFVTGPIGLDISSWSSQVSSASLCRSTSSPVVLFIGRLINSKGICQFVKVAEAVKYTLPDCRFVVLGGLEHGFDSVSEKELESWVSSGLIEWHGHVPVLEWIKGAKCLLLPTFYREGSPRVIQESMALGIPVISTTIPSISSMIAHGVNGFILDPFDVNAFASCVISLLSSPSLWSSISSSSRSYALQHFDAHENAQRMFDLMHC